MQTAPPPLGAILLWTQGLLSLLSILSRLSIRPIVLTLALLCLFICSHCCFCSPCLVTTACYYILFLVLSLLFACNSLLSCCSFWDPQSGPLCSLWVVTQRLACEQLFRAYLVLLRASQLGNFLCGTQGPLVATPGLPQRPPVLSPPTPSLLKPLTHRLFSHQSPHPYRLFLG
jgi:hypothetical protein